MKRTMYEAARHTPKPEAPGSSPGRRTKSAVISTDRGVFFAFECVVSAENFVSCACRVRKKCVLWRKALCASCTVNRRRCIDAKRSDTVYVSLLYVLYYAAANAAKKNNEKIPGAPKACRVSASYCICSQLMMVRFAG